jgi:hypothetical protein
MRFRLSKLTRTRNPGDGLAMGSLLSESSCRMRGLHRRFGGVSPCRTIRRPGPRNTRDIEDERLRFDPEVQPFDIDDPDPSPRHLNDPCLFQCFQCALDDLTYRPNHCRNLILSVLKTQAGRVLNERCLPSGAIQEQPGHTSDNVPKREILDEHLIRTKARWNSRMTSRATSA